MADSTKPYKQHLDDFKQVCVDLSTVGVLVANNDVAPTPEKKKAVNIAAKKWLEEQFKPFFSRFDV